MRSSSITCGSSPRGSVGGVKLGPQVYGVDCPGGGLRAVVVGAFVRPSRRMLAGQIDQCAESDLGRRRASSSAANALGRRRIVLRRLGRPCRKRLATGLVPSVAAQQASPILFQSSQARSLFGMTKSGSPDGGMIGGAIELPSAVAADRPLPLKGSVQRRTASRRLRPL